MTPWNVAYQASPSMGFSRQEYWNGLPFPSAGDLPDPGNEPRSPALEADALTSEPPGKSSDYTVEVTNRLKGLNMIERVPEELWMDVYNIVHEAVIKTIPKIKIHEKAKWLPEEA